MRNKPAPDILDLSELPTPPGRLSSTGHSHPSSGSFDFRSECSCRHASDSHACRFQRSVTLNSQRDFFDAKWCYRMRSRLVITVVRSRIKPMRPDEHPFGALAPRDAHQRGLHRTMTLGGEYATRNHTVKHLQDLKGKTVLIETMPFTTSEAAAAEEAGIDTLKVKFDPVNPADAIAMRKAAPHTFCLLYTSPSPRDRG